MAKSNDGNFYLTLSASSTGGSTSTSATGSILQLTPAGVATQIYQFDTSTVAASGALVQANDGLYGTTAVGGVAGNNTPPNGAGTIFRLVISPHPLFFNGEKDLANGVEYLAFPDGNYFGYYAFLSDPHYIYHFDLGYEYVFNAFDAQNSVYLYDFAEKDFFYTNPSIFPYLYSFNKKAELYYYPDPNNPGRSNTNGVRYFFQFNADGRTGTVIQY